MPALSKGHQQEKEQCQQQKRLQQQDEDLCGKTIKVAGNEVRNMDVNVAVIKNIVAVKVSQVAGVLSRVGSEVLPGPGNTVIHLKTNL
jgi:hypothetical protein